jgi:hypothetical protein
MFRSTRDLHQGINLKQDGLKPNKLLLYTADVEESQMVTT